MTLREALTSIVRHPPLRGEQEDGGHVRRRQRNLCARLDAMYERLDERD